METRIGFVGCYSHDVIMILAKVVSCMERKVLLRDLNQQHPLRASVPIPEDLCVTRACGEYDGVLFTEQPPGREKEERCEVELIDFGMSVRKEEARRCSELVLVTDMLPHHIRCLARVDLPAEAVKVCIIRDAIEGMCRKEKEVRDFLHRFPERKVFYLPPDFRDVKNRYVCETLHEYSIRRCSPEMQDVVYYMAGVLCPDSSEKEIRRRVRYQERRCYR